MRIQTFISPVSFREKVETPGLSPVQADGRPLSWLDSLLTGGVEIPKPIFEFKSRPLIWLVSGPPGTGKTTFGLEFCYRLATQNQPDARVPKLFTTYYSAESSKDVIFENMAAFGWPHQPEALEIHGSEELRNVTKPGELFKKLPRQQVEPNILPYTEGIDHAREGYHVVVVDSLNVLASQLSAVKPSKEDSSKPKSPSSESEPDLATSEWSPARLIESIDNQLKGHTWILMLMQDWEHDQGKDPPYAFFADIETRFYEKSFKNYLLRYFRIVKMRFQAHAHGNHVVKIYGRPNPTDAAAKTTGLTMPASQATGFEISEGGIYILPSIHRHLSAFVDDVAPALAPGALSAPVLGLDSIMPLGGAFAGFPKRRCTALVGSRGAMKSHLAYLTLLKALETDEKSAGIMFSLRDDVRAAQTSLNEIATQQGMAGISAEKFGSENRLDIVYFAPGYIPPEEFMHRVVVAIEGMIQRRKGSDGRDIIVVLNGIDHLAARHPLCAAEDMFVPALLSYFRKTRVTSLVVAANDDRKPIDDSGLLPMADLLLNFRTCSCRPSLLPPDAKQVTEVTSQRVPAGATSGGEGYMYRRADQNGKLEFSAFTRVIDSVGNQHVVLQQGAETTILGH